MPATATEARLDGIVRDLFDVVTHVGLATPRGRRRADALKEVEYLTLALLAERGTMIVGDIQRLLGVLPAQMSRIIRALENRTEPLIVCQINPRDKRKIDVCPTDSGSRALREYQDIRIRRIATLLHDLPAEDQDELIGLLDKVRGLLERGSAADPLLH